jgi:4-phytase/acid phosphatase
MDREANVLTIAEIVRDSAAMNEAALGCDFEEARFLAQLVAGKARAAGLTKVAETAARVLSHLGPPGSAPLGGYGEAMLALASSLDDVGFDPI